MRSSWSEPLSHYLEKRGLRLTKQRQIIAEVFFEASGHPSVEDIHQRVRSRNPKIGQATVYRTLKLLQESGLANASRFGGETRRFESTLEQEHHDHLICTRCATIIEFLDPIIEERQEKVAEDLGFKLESHKQELYGVCAACLKDPKQSPRSVMHT